MIQIVMLIMEKNSEDNGEKETSATDNLEYGVEFDKSQFTYDETEDIYYMLDLCTEFYGTMGNADEVSSASIVITNDVGKTVLSRQIEPESKFTVPNAGLLIGNNHVELTVNYKDGQVVTEKFVVYSLKEESMNNLDIDFSDTDGDGLNGFLEEMYGTNPDKKDTDGDGLPDYEELVVIGYDPNKVDSDGNGINDGDEDIDEDGLTNLEEVTYGTDNCTVDTDGDSLTDYEEIKEYKTNPLSRDTDGDGADDNDEINNGTDPNSANASISEYDYLENDEINVEVVYEAQGKYIDTFYIDINKEYDFFYDDGYMGPAFEMGIDGGFVKAELTIQFNDLFIEWYENIKPTLYKVENGKLTEIKTTWDGTSDYVTATISEVGIYVLMDKTSCNID